MKAPSLLVIKLWPRLKFLFTHPTRTHTDADADADGRAVTLAPGHSSRLAKKLLCKKNTERLKFQTFALTFCRDAGALE